VNARNNSIEDVHIESFWDGIEVANFSGTVANVLLSNVTGSTSGQNNTCCQTTNVVHLCGKNPWDQTIYGTCATENAAIVEDITILNATNFSAPYTVGTTGIQPTAIADDVTANAIPACRQQGNPPGCATALATAIYALGEPDAGGTSNPAYSKFTSNPATPKGNYPATSSFVPT